MNKTNIEHLAIAIGLQLMLWPFFGLAVAGVIAVTAFFAREVAQHEYHLAHDRGWQWGEVMPVRWHEGLLYWSRDSALDVLTPAAGCATVAIIGWLLG